MSKNFRFRKKENFFSFLFSLFSFYLPSIATVRSLSHEENNTQFEESWNHQRKKEGGELGGREGGR